MNIYESILQGLNEAIEYEKGNLEADTSKLTTEDGLEVQAAEKE